MISHGVTADEETASFIRTDQGRQRVVDLFTLREFRVVWPPSGYTLTQPRVKEKKHQWKSAKCSTSHAATRTCVKEKNLWWKSAKYSTSHIATRTRVKEKNHWWKSAKYSTSHTATSTRVKEKNRWWKSAKCSTSHAATRTQTPCSGPESVIFPLGLGGSWVSTSPRCSAAKRAGA